MHFSCASIAKSAFQAIHGGANYSTHILVCEERIWQLFAQIRSRTDLFTFRPNPLQNGFVHFSPKSARNPSQPNTIQHNPTQPNTTQHNPTQPNTTQHKPSARKEDNTVDQNKKKNAITKATEHQRPQKQKDAIGHKNQRTPSTGDPTEIHSLYLKKCVHPETPDRPPSGQLLV